MKRNTDITLNKIIKPQEKSLKEEEKNYKNNQKTNTKMIISAYLSIITLNVNELNAPIKRYRVADCILKTRPIYMLPTGDSLQS